MGMVHTLSIFWSSVLLQWIGSGRQVTSIPPFGSSSSFQHIPWVQGLIWVWCVCGRACPYCHRSMDDTLCSQKHDSFSTASPLSHLGVCAAEAITLCHTWHRRTPKGQENHKAISQSCFFAGSLCKEGSVSQPHNSSFLSLLPSK